MQMSFLNKKNKKADASVLIFVALTVVLCGFALFSFISSNLKYEKKVSQADIVTGFYGQNIVFEFYLRDIANTLLNQDSEQTNEAFLQNFIKAYENNPMPAFDIPFYNNQIKNASKYVINIDEQKLSFKIKDFNFVKDYGLDKSQDIKAISQVKNISFDVK